MKKFKAWHLAIICLAVFLIFAGVAAVIIVNNDDYHSADRWNMSWSDNDWDIGFGIGKEYTIDQNETIDVNSKFKIDISTISSDISITQTTGSKVTVHLYGDYNSRKGEITLEIADTGSTVKIMVKYPKNGGISRSNLRLDIQVPQDYDQDLYVHTVSSDILLECQDMIFDSIDIDTVSGTTNINTIRANSLTFDAVSGSIRGSLIESTLKANGVSGKVNITGLSADAEIDTVSGDITLALVKNSDLNINTTSGDVEIKLGSNTDFYIKYDSVSGDFSCDIPLTIVRQKGSDFEGYAGDKNSPEISVDSVSGDLSINE